MKKEIWQMTKREIRAFSETVAEVPAQARLNREYQGQGVLYEFDGHYYLKQNGVITHTIHAGAHRWMIDTAIQEGKPVPDEVKKDYVGILFTNDLNYMWSDLLKKSA